VSFSIRLRPRSKAAANDAGGFAVGAALPAAPIVQGIIEIIVRLGLFLNHVSDFLGKCRSLFGRERAYLRAQLR
jgi:hypothetical protein